jgi:predicted MPP superfamily phosphohydrolase
MAGTAAAAGVLGRFAARSHAAEARPLLRFVQLNDAHVDSKKPSDYRLANAKLRYLVKSLGAGTDAAAPDFVVGIGDMVTGEKPDMAADFALLKTLLAGLKCPYYPVVGNHEVGQQEGRAEYEAPYRKVFGNDRVNYTVRHAGVQFVMLDDSGAPASNATEVGRRRRRWLRDVLEGSPDPKILCCHIPLVPLREEAVLKKSFGFGSYIAHDGEMLKLVESHADRIIAVLSGHLHLTGMVRRQGICHITVSGTASYPCDFASYEVFADRIRIRVHSLPKELLTPETDIHGKPRFATDYTDVAHPTHESYVRGNPAEREFDIAWAEKGPARS